MRRRDFAFLIGAATIAPRTLFAQMATRPPVVGSLWFGTKEAPLIVRYLGQFLAGMRDLATPRVRTSRRFLVLLTFTRTAWPNSPWNWFNSNRTLSLPPRSSTPFR